MIPRRGPEALGWDASRWQRLLHDLRSERGVLADAEEALSDAALGSLLEGIDDASDDAVEAVEAGVADAVQRLGRGVYGHLYADPDAAPTGPAWAQAAALAVAMAPGLSDLRDGVVGDPDMVAIGESVLLRTVAQELPEILRQLRERGVDPSEEPGDGEGQDGDGEGGGDGDEDGEGKARGEAVRAAIEAVGEEVARRLMAGVVDAQEEVGEARGDLNGLLPGLGTAPPSHEQEDPRRLDLVEKIREDDRLRKILRLAGRMRHLAERKRFVPSEHGREEVVDVERGADLGRVLPSELAGLRRGGVRRLLALKGIADRTLLQYRTTGTEPLGYGPIVLMLDASGSMDAGLAGGMNRIDWCAAIGIAAVRTAVRQGRPVAICAFDGEVLTRWTWKVDGRNRRAAEDAVFGLLGIHACGGTSFDPPVRWALDHGAADDRADLVLVTDGMGYLAEETVARVADARERGLALWGILAGEGGLPDVLNKMADAVITVDGEDAADKIGAMSRGAA